jgi:hypothetical protein
MTTPNYRSKFLERALSCGAILTGKPDGSEPITVVFSIDAWRAFDVSCQMPTDAYLKAKVAEGGTFAWEMQAARGECAWVCASCCQSFPDGMPDACPNSETNGCTEIIQRDKQWAERVK